MRRYGLALVSLFIALLIAACGGASSPAASPTPGGPAGAEAIAPSGADDVAVTADLAGMRANPVLARFLAEGKSKAAPGVDEIVEKIDRVDLRASVPKDGTPAIVAVVWGKLSRDPRQLASFKATAEPKTLASGVTEWIEGSEGAPHVFVVSDQVWVVTTGAMTDRARERFATSAAPPPAPSGDLIRVRANGAAVAKAPELGQLLGDIDKIDITLGANASSLRAVLAFKESESAKKAEAQVRALAGLLTLAVAGAPSCKALQKLSVDVSQSSNDVAVDVKGLGDALASWDETACAKPSSAHASLDGPVAVPPPPPPLSEGPEAQPSNKKLCELVAKHRTLPVDQKIAEGVKREAIVAGLAVGDRLLATMPAKDPQRELRVAESAKNYGAWQEAIKNDCAADKTAKATVGDVAVAGRISKRTKELCKELKRFPKSPQCR